MPRPRKLRNIMSDAPVSYYKPQGVPLRGLGEVVLSLDGLEALRLADAEKMDQTEASALMGISRPTFSRLLQEARFAVASALSQGNALRIDGGPVVVAEEPPQGCMRRGGGGGQRRRRRGGCTNAMDVDLSTHDETVSEE